MTRTIDSDQAPLYRRSEMVRIDLIHLITYTDRENDTVDKHFYFSRMPVTFDWDNGDTDQEFWPVLRKIGSLTCSINHLATPEDTELLRKPLEIVLSNEPFGADSKRLIEILQDHTLENARIEWTQILLADRPTTARVDLTALDGDEHTFWYRGCVNRVGPITNNSITLSCETEVPNPIFLRAEDASKNDPSDYGRRLPIIYGAAKRVKAVAYEVGWVTTLAEDITDSTTGNVKFTDLSGISGSGNTLRIDGEEVTVTYVDDTTGNITARAQNSTAAAAHSVGAPVIEMITTATYIVAGHQVDAINEIYMRSPIDGSLVRLDSSEFGYTKTLADTTTISGETIASVSFTEAQFRAVVEYLAATGGVTQQPDFEADTGEYVFVPAMAYEAWTSAHSDCNSLLDIDGGRVYGDSGSTNGVKFYWPTGSVNDSGHEVVRWRIKATCSGRAGISSGNYDTRLEVDEANVPNVTGSAYKTFTSYSNVEYGATAVSPWYTCSDGTTLGDLESGGSGAALYVDCYQYGSGSTWNGNNFAWILAGDAGMEAELEPQSLTRTDDVEIDALSAAMGNGIELYADVDGYEAPDATYNASSGTLMTKPGDILKHWIVAIGGVSVHSSEYSNCITNLGSNVWGFDARTLGSSWEEIAARMAFEARATLVPEETSSGTEWKMLTALSTYAFSAASGEITEWDRGGFVEADQDVRFTHASRFSFPYAPDWSKGDGEEAFTQIVIANEDTNDLTTPTTANFQTAADKIGAYEAEPMAFRCIQVEATAEEIAGYYCHERIRVPARLFAVKGVPWWEAYNIEVGDILEITPPWETSPLKARVIEYVKDPSTEQVELRLVEVE